ncbi:hypothetical protein [Pseudomonas pseudonitroreducens]|uniref:hypothetical protein n=1 Tax=Pseudomonas pseudonitroreducens TaxID=2892326 RepID=UPI001F3974B7|nr:hypothetical protein [Pseudomonas pseudonitroreducens]
MSAADARRASGSSMEASRRASGKALIDDLRAIQDSNTQERRLSQIPQRGALAGQRSRADYVAPAAAVSGGIASPLTEPDAATREYFDSVLVPTTDGLIWARWKSLKKIHMVDANNAPVAFEFKNGVQK